MVTPAASESIWPASASRDSEPDSTAPTIWMRTTPSVMPRTATRRFRCRPVAVIPWLWLWSCPMLTRLAPAQLVQPDIGNAELVRDFMDHRDGHFVDHVLPGGADLQDGFAEDGDPVGKGTGVPP